MIIDSIQKLEAARAEVSKLEHAVAVERDKALAGLPKQYGFDSLAAFIKAVKAAAGGKRAGKATARKSRKRAVITAETKDKVKSLVAAGKTGSEIASALGISLPSVQNIKKELGLTKARKK